MSAYARWEQPNARPDLSRHVRSPPREQTLLEALGSLKGMTNVVLDFEAYYSKDYNIRKLTTEAYVRGPEWETLGVGVQVGSTPRVWLEDWEFREWTQRVDWDRAIVTAQQAQFEGLILAHHYDVRPAFFVDTMYLARALHGPGKARLETLGPMYGLGEKGKGLEAVKGKHRRDLTQAQWLELGAYCLQDVAITAGLVPKMIRQLPPEELWLIDSIVRMFSEPVFRGDRQVLDKALKEELDRKAALFRKVAEHAGAIEVKQSKRKPLSVEQRVEKVLGSSDKFASLLKLMGVEPPTKLNDAGATAWAFAKDDPGMQSLLEHPDEDVALLAEARLEVTSRIITSRTQRIIASSERGAIPFYLKFDGAHTQRLSGGDKMNPQNFNRGGSLRDAITVEEWLRLVVADSGQIEARVIAWLAGDTQLLDTFRRNDAIQARHETRVAELEAAGVEHDAAAKQADAEGFPEGDFYSDRGSALFLKKLSKRETPAERQLSKNMILGLGFSMGWAKFGCEQLKGMLGSKPVQFTRAEIEKYRIDVGAFVAKKNGKVTCADRVDDLLTFGLRLKTASGQSARDAAMIHFAVADYLVTLFRRTNRPIVRLWHTCESILGVMARDGDPGEVRMEFSGLKVRRHSIEKPNGRVLHYRGLRKTAGGYSYLGGESGRQWKKVYGGLLTENLVQSLARDIVMWQALWIRAKYAHAVPGRRSPLGTTTHDEVVTIVPAELAEECLAYSLERLRVPPAWCAGLPLNASGGFGVSYGAVK